MTGVEILMPKSYPSVCFCQNSIIYYHSAECQIAYITDSPPGWYYVKRLLFQVLAEEGLNPVEGNLLEVVVEVGVDCAWDDEQLLVVALELLVGVLAEIAGMGVLTVDEEDSALDFTGIRQDRHIEEGQ